MCVYDDTEHVMESMNEDRDLILLKEMNEHRELIRLKCETEMNDRHVIER